MSSELLCINLHLCSHAHCSAATSPSLCRIHDGIRKCSRHLINHHLYWIPAKCRKTNSHFFQKVNYRLTAFIIIYYIPLAFITTSIKALLYNVSGNLLCINRTHVSQHGRRVQQRVGWWNRLRTMNRKIKSNGWKKSVSHKKAENVHAQQAGNISSPSKTDKLQTRDINIIWVEVFLRILTSILEFWLLS